MDERTINLLESFHVPNTYWKGRSVEYQYWFRSLLHKIDSSLDITGLPDTWPQDFLMICLWALGYVAVFKTERWGITFQPCTISGYDFYYQPEKCLISNPKYSKELTLHKDAELMKLTPDFMGIFDVLDHYATQLAEITKGIQMGLVNAKTPMVLSAKNQAQSETLKKIFDKVQAGEPLVIWKDTQNEDEVIPHKEVFESWNQDFKQTYIVSTLLDDMQKILNSFYMEIGLPTTLDKKSHVLDSEAEFQSAQSQARIACWVTTLRESFAKINKMFNLTLEVEYHERENDLDWDGTDSQRGREEYR